MKASARMTARLARLFAAYAHGDTPHAGTAGTPRTPGWEALEAALERVLAAARASWPGVALDESDFMKHLAERVPLRRDGGDERPSEGRMRDPIAALDRVHASDLYLACACARGDPNALSAFQRRFWPEVSAYVGSVDRSAAFADEVRQLLWQRLFVAAPGSRTKISDYSGAGPLGAWLRVSAIRTARSIRRAEKPHVEPPRGLAGGTDPELDYLKTRYSAEINEALRRTLASLPPRERNILALYFVDGMSSAAIGELYQVHGATVRRWIERARDHLVRETRKLLSEQLKLRPRDLDSLIALVQSRLDVSVTGLLRSPRA